MANDKQEIKVNFPEKLQGGVYANNMIVTHTRGGVRDGLSDGGAAGRALSPHG